MHEIMEVLIKFEVVLAEVMRRCFLWLEQVAGTISNLDSSLAVSLASVAFIVSQEYYAA